MVKRIDRTALDPLLGATCGRRAVFEVENRGSRGSDRAQILSAAVVCCHQKNNRALLDQVDRAMVASTRKNRRKKGIAPVIERRNRPLLGPDRIRSEIVGLFPSPAAQPAPRVHSSLRVFLAKSARRRRAGNFLACDRRKFCHRN